MRKATPAVVALALALAACGGGTDRGTDETDHPGATCEPSGAALSITAKGTAFDVDCLAAPAGEAFTIAFRNDDAGTSHNVAIYTAADAKTSLFKGEIFAGLATKTYAVRALGAGTYHFHCDLHPVEMQGTFVVK